MVTEDWLDARGKQSFGSVEMVRRVGVTRGMSKAPCYQAEFIY